MVPGTRRWGNYFTGPHVQQLFTSSYPWVITYSQQISYTNEKGELSQGLLLIDMNFRTVSELSQSAKLGATGYVYFIDNNGKIVYHPYQQLINSDLFNEDLESAQEYIFGTFTNTFEEGRLSSSHGEQRLGNQGKHSWTADGRLDATTIMLIVLGFCIHHHCSGTWFLHKSRPIGELDRLMNSVERETSPPSDGRRTQGSDCPEPAVMVKRIRRLMDIVTNQEMKRVRADTAGKNNHFLYSTLDSVVWIAKTYRE